MSELHPLTNLIKRDNSCSYASYDEEIRAWLEERAMEIMNNDVGGAYSIKDEEELRRILGIEKPKEKTLEEKLDYAFYSESRGRTENHVQIATRVAREHFANGGK